MKQDLPLSYPRMIEKYLEDRINERNLTEDDNFDEVIFDHNTYSFDIHSDAEVVRITNKDTNQLWNVTKWDCRSEYEDMIELNELLDYIEQQVKFTVHDWVKHYTKEGPIYAGALVNIYNDGASQHIDIISGGAIYITDTNNVKLTGGIDYVCETSNDSTHVELDIEHTTETGKYTNDIKGTVENLALNLLNAEHVMSYVQAPLRNSAPPIALHDSVFELSKYVTACGLITKIDKENKIVTFNNNGYDYTILKDGTWHNNEAKAPMDKKNELGLLYYRTSIYMRFNTSEEKNFVRGVIALLNIISV